MATQKIGRTLDPGFQSSATRPAVNDSLRESIADKSPTGAALCGWCCGIEKAVSLAGLEPLIGEIRGVVLEDAGVGGDIRELWLVANAVRHGEGRSLRDLATAAPKLWAHLPTNAIEAGHAQAIGDMRLKDSDLQRYTLAVTKFWAAAGASSVPGL
jgi:hypothetical protein